MLLTWHEFSPSVSLRILPKEVALMPMIVRLFAFLCLALPGITLAQTSFVETHSGNIASDPQYDLYTVQITAGTSVTSTLVCDLDGVSRPLDPILSVFFPGSDASDIANADVYDDDGFGTDDNPLGVDCDAFESSRVIFVAPVTGSYVFRADGFGSSTGPYTLTIRGTPPAPAPVPALGVPALVLLAAGVGLLARRRRRPGA